MGHSFLMGSYSNIQQPTQEPVANHKIAGPAGQQGQQSCTRTKTNDLNSPPGPCSHTQLEYDLTKACDKTLKTLMC